MRITVIPNDPEEAILTRLAVLPMPSAYSVYAGNRRAVVLEQTALAEFDATVARYRGEIRVRFAWMVRRVRRELGSLRRLNI
jgi:hypothetical protein